MTYGVVAIHYQGDDKFALARVDRVNLRSSGVVPTLLDSAGWWVSRLIKKAPRATGNESETAWMKGVEGRSSGDIGNIKYKCNLPRFMSGEERRERERESSGEKRKATRRRRKRMVMVSRRDEVAARRSGDHTESWACSWLVGGPSFHFPPALLPRLHSLP